MNKIAIWIASIITETAVHDAKEAWRVIGVVIVMILAMIWVSSTLRHSPGLMEGVPPNALAQ